MSEMGEWCLPGECSWSPSEFIKSTQRHTKSITYSENWFKTFRWESLSELRCDCGVRSGPLIVVFMQQNAQNIDNNLSFHFVFLHRECHEKATLWQNMNIFLLIKSCWIKFSPINSVVSIYWLRQSGQQFVLSFWYEIIKTLARG